MIVILHLQGQVAFSWTLLELFEPKVKCITIDRSVVNFLGNDKKSLTRRLEN